MCPFRGGVGSPFNTMWPGLRLTSIPSGILIHPDIWLQYTMTEKWGAAVPLFWGGAGFPPKTMSSGQRPTSVPNGILVHPAVW